MTESKPADPLIGTIVSERYRVLERIGRGGFGAVYRVQHVRLDKILALKVLFEHAHQNPRMIKRFEREARATCRIGRWASGGGPAPCRPSLHGGAASRRPTDGRGPDGHY